MSAFKNDKKIFTNCICCNSFVIPSDTYAPFWCAYDSRRDKMVNSDLSFDEVEILRQDKYISGCGRRLVAYKVGNYHTTRQALPDINESVVLNKTYSPEIKKQL